MVEINIVTIILIAFFTGLGSGIGNPIGMHIYKKYVESKLNKTTDHVDNIKYKLKEEVSKTINGTKNIEQKILGGDIDE